MLYLLLLGMRGRIYIFKGVWYNQNTRLQIDLNTGGNDDGRKNF